MSREPDPDWFLRDWMKIQGKRQGDLVKELGYHKTAAARIWHSRQPYRRQDINTIAKWLEIRPFELLMPPDDALALRRLKESAVAIASALATSQQDNVPPAPAKKMAS